MVKTAAAARRDGLQAEEVVKDYLRFRGYKVHDSEPWSDMHFDIDAYIEHPKDIKRFIPISIKSNEPKYADAAFLFELRIGFLDGKILEGDSKPSYYETTHIGKLDYWVKPVRSWYHRSQASFYMVWKRDSDSSGYLWMLDKHALNRYVEQHGFEKVTTTSAAVAMREVREGKAWTEIGLISQSTLQQAGIARKIGYINMD